METLASAAECLERLSHDRPACLVLDVRLPGLDGLDLQERLVEDKISTPVVFITGHGDVPMSVRAMKSGAVGTWRRGDRPGLGGLATVTSRAECHAGRSRFGAPFGSV